MVPLASIIVDELAPKVFALRNREWVCLSLSPAMQWFAYSVFPVVWLLEAAVTEIVKLGERGWSSRRDGTAREGTLQELRGAAALARMSRFNAESRRPTCRRWRILPRQAWTRSLTGRVRPIGSWRMFA